MCRLPAALFVWALCHIGSVNGFVTPRDEPTAVNAASSAIVTPGFQFDSISQMTTCKPAVISWLYSPVTVDDPLELLLYITNDNVAQPPAPSSTATGIFTTPDGRRAVRRDTAVVLEITPEGGIDPLLRTYTWPSVNVTAGWYELEATLPLPGFTEESLSFYVANGTNVSCFAGAAPPASASSASSVPNPTSSGGPTSPISTGGAAQTSSAATLPVTSGSSSSKVNRGAIAGGVIGGLAVIAAAIAAYFYLRYASASTASGASGKKRTRKWAGLGSTDSKAKMYPSTSRSAAGAAVSGRHHSQSDSIGPMISSHDSNLYVIGNVGIDSRPSRRAETLDEEEDEVNSYFSPSQEKISSPSNGSPLRSPFSESGHGHDEDAVPLDFIAPLPGNSAVTRNSSTSTSSYMNNNFSRPRSHPTSPYSSPTIGEGPFSDSARNTTTSTLGHDPSSYPPTPSPAYPSGTSQAMSESPVPARRGSIGEPIAGPTRRTPRKPVPQYNPTDPTLSSPPPAMPSPLPPVHDYSDSSREGSIRSGAGAAQELPRLTHKGSFGDGRPVHYLIPDMPPPQRD